MDGLFFGLKIHVGNHWFYLRVDLHRQEQPEACMRLHGVELLLQLHEPSWGQVDVLQHHPPATPNDFWISARQGKVQMPRVHHEQLVSPARLDSRVDVFVGFIEALCRTCGYRRNNSLTPPSCCCSLQTHVCCSPIEMEVICLFCSAARSLTRPLASYPGTEHMSTGVLGLTCGGKMGQRRFKNSCRHMSDNNVRRVILYLAVHDVAEVKRLLDDVHEGLSECL